ncbi:uncharacterized protein LOC105686135 isoform X2 [Athalia rosae]|uniref:uncharacterized protein LOC105686135 isoform X2 n=1 Tax=Athalia rosae TaxID=37344 RepID=UPI002033935A|nr:uncharacterized protein LOC105686135 isoform X2 [Athalia rosae]
MRLPVLPQRFPAAREKGAGRTSRVQERGADAPAPYGTPDAPDVPQVDSSALEELPLRRGARGLPQKLRNQAGKLRSRLRSIQRPKFSLGRERQKTEKVKQQTKPDKSTTAATNITTTTTTTTTKKSERPRFSLPERPRFSFPDRAKFAMPERPRLNIKRPNLSLPSLGRAKKPLKDRQSTGESNTGSKRNIFDVSTYPRLFDKRSKSRGDYATSSPIASRGQSPETATVPRVKKKPPVGAGWVQRFSDIRYADDEPEGAVERSKPWRRPSLEEPRVSSRSGGNAESAGRIPWEESDETYDARYPTTEFEEADSREDATHADAEETERNEDSEGATPEERRTTTGGPPPLPGEGPGAPPPPRAPEEDSSEATGLPREDWAPGYEADEVEVPEGYSGDTGGDEEEEAEEEEQGGYGGRFMPIDPPSKTYAARVESSLDEEISGRSDREQQSSGSSGDRRRRGVLEEIDSDEFFLRARGISGDDVNVGRFIATEIRDAFRSTGANALADLRADLDGAPPARPLRTRSLRKRREREAPTGPTGPPGPPGGGPPPRPKRDRRHSGESARVDEGDGRGEPGRTGSVSGSRHRVIYQTEGVPGGPEPLDDIVVVKPARRKSRSVARSRSDSGSAAIVPPPPVAPRRRKRGRVRDPGGNPVDLDAARRTLCNGHTRPTDWSEGVEFSPEVHDDLENQNPEDRLQSVVARLEHDYIEPAPIAPKRRSRSRGTSVADDDRTSRGAESLPELGYPEEEEGEGEEEEEAGAGVPGDTESLPGYAVVEKREKPPRPPPPRRRREKFGGPAVPVRPRRAYSTLGPSRRRSATPEEEDKMAERTDVTPYTELDSDEPDSHDAQGGGKDLDKIQGRPLPAPPRPPRARREAATDGVAEVAEVAAATQTDPLPDDVVLIEEEVTSAKLVVAPSRTGSQILVSSERIATPTFGRSSPAVPPLPRSLRRDGAPTSGRIRTPEYESDEEEAGMEEGPADGVPPASLASALPLGEERLRIASLEVADLRVERLNVSQLEAHKISASEVDAVMVSASEISNNSIAEETASIHPSLLKELIAIRNHLEQVASSPRLRERSPEIERRRSPDKGEGELLSPVDRLIAELRRSDGTGGEESEPPETGDTLTLTSPESEDSARPDVRTEDSVEGETRAEVRSGDDGGKPLIETTRFAGDVPAAKESEPIETRDATVAEKSEIPDAVTTASSAHRESPVPPTEPGLSAPAGHPAPKTGGSESLGKDEDKGDKRKPSRSRSSSPSKDGKRPVRQTASPVRSLPPLISVTPDRSDPVPCPVPEVQVLPQRAIVSYVQNGEEEVLQRPTVGATRFVAFPTSQIPADFFSLASPLSSGLEPEPTVAESTQQLMRAMRIAGTRAMRHFVGYVSSRVSVEDRGEKTKEIELALCALLLLIAGLLILCFGSPRTVTHHHHWDYFNPPQ